MLDIIDKPGCITKAAMREYFERSIKDTPAFKKNTPLHPILINGEFHHYLDADTDTMWLGFAIGMRCAERIAAKSASPNAQAEERAAENDAELTATRWALESANAHNPLAEPARNVVTAFEKLGRTHDAPGLLLARANCENSMLALRDALTPNA